MVEVNGETYVTASDAVRDLRISRWMFYNAVRPVVKAYRVGAKKWPHYKKTDIEASLQQVREVRLSDDRNGSLRIQR